MTRIPSRPHGAPLASPRGDVGALPAPARGPAVSPRGDVCARPIPAQADVMLPRQPALAPLGDLCALPIPTPADAARGTASAFTLRVARMAGGWDALAVELNAVKGHLSLVAPGVPGGGGAAVEAALAGTGDHILGALDAGRITLEEARRSLHSVAEMVDVLEAVQQGRVTVAASGHPLDATAKAMDVTTTRKDVVRLMIRTEGDAKGQARLKLTQLADDGVEVPATHRLMVRIDLEGSERSGAAVEASVDVEFGDGKRPPPGEELLDVRIHGVMLDGNGQPVLSRGGNAIADHHFSAGVPDALRDRDGFRSFTQGFLDQVLPEGGAPAA